MTKRESGWYRVWYNEGDEPWLALYDHVFNSWSAPYSDCGYSSDEFHKIDPQMVMTPSGQIVYNQPAHDPLYNTKQEG
ncbi:MAG: hypothetical protein ACRDC6_20435 [Shewanella sp.]